ncbi:MAG: hypothetical protein KAR21_15475, partial [Spirochaetales bacterium]|nr:hypothetical protein [Spirochaetales bacterium]
MADNSYQTKVKKIFKGHNVKFIAVENKDMTKSKVLENLEGADIFLINTHGCSKPFNGMQCLQVAPSEDNNNVLTITSILGDEKISLLTSLDIKKALHGKKKPKLVIFNMCYGINPSDVPPKNLFSAAFGIDDKTQGRAFISWKDARYGFAMDSGILNHILSNKDKKWTVKDEKTGKYPKLKDVYSNKSSGAPFIIGDTNTRFITDEYFVLFQVTFPIVKKDRKIKKREEESKEEWKQRKKAYYQALGANDFTFQEIPLEKNQLIIKVVEDGMQYYSEDYFTQNSEFTLKINGTTKTTDGERVPLKGALLLTRKSIYQSLEDLLDTYPFIQEKREKLNIPIFNRENGFARSTAKAGDKNHFTVGPINK